MNCYSSGISESLISELNRYILHNATSLTAKEYKTPKAITEEVTESEKFGIIIKNALDEDRHHSKNKNQIIH